MINKEVPSLGTYSFFEINQAFMRGSNGQIFFINKHGRYITRHIVFENGKINPTTEDFPAPIEKMELIDNKNLGITKLVYATKEEAVDRGWP